MSVSLRQQFAVAGAKVRKSELEAELRVIHKAFPELNARTMAPVVKRRKRKGMSASARKAVSTRMKKYWADKAKEKKK